MLRLIAGLLSQDVVDGLCGVGKMVFLRFNDVKKGWRTPVTEGTAMPAIVEYPQVVSDALPDFADLFAGDSLAALQRAVDLVRDKLHQELPGGDDHGPVLQNA